MMTLGAEYGALIDGTLDLSVSVATCSALGRVCILIKPHLQLLFMHHVILRAHVLGGTCYKNKNKHCRSLLVNFGAITTDTVKPINVDTLESGHLLYTGHFFWSQCNTNVIFHP